MHALQHMHAPVYSGPIMSSRRFRVGSRRLPTIRVIFALHVRQSPLLGLCGILLPLSVARGVRRCLLLGEVGVETDREYTVKSTVNHE
jgi:hypothetical protein